MIEEDADGVDENEGDEGVDIPDVEAEIEEEYWCEVLKGPHSCKVDEKGDFICEACGAINPF